MSIDERLLLKVQRAAERLDISRSLLYELIAAGRIRALKINGATRITAAELERFVADLAANDGR